MMRAPEPLPPGLRQLLVVGFLLSACGGPLYVLPDNAPAEPTWPAAVSIDVACDEPARRVIPLEDGAVRAIGPLTLRALDARGHVLGGEDCANTPSGALTVKEKGLLEVSVGQLERGGNEWGTLCFCRDKFPWSRCIPDCTDPEDRIDVRVSCPETRFAKREAYGVPSAPLPAHLPVDITCTRAPDDGGKLHCNPAIVSLEKASVLVYGVLQLTAGPRDVSPNDVLAFSPAPNAPLKGEGKALLCLHGACTHPAYTLSLKVTFRDAATSGAAPSSPAHQEAPQPR